MTLRSQKVFSIVFIKAGTNSECGSILDSGLLSHDEQLDRSAEKIKRHRFFMVEGIRKKKKKREKKQT